MATVYVCYRRHTRQREHAAAGGEEGAAGLSFAPLRDDFDIFGVEVALDSDQE